MLKSRFNLGKPFFLVMAMVMAMSVLFISGPSKANAFTSSDADTAMNAFNTAYYRVTNGNGYFNKYSDGGTIQSDFWTEAEMIEVVEDAYDRSQNITYKNQINELYNGFVNKWGSDWTSNVWNDDLIWIVLATERAYQITGNVTYKNQAKYHFDAVYARAYSTALGGGLFETTSNQSKNACVNGPAIVAATKLYQITGDVTYLDKAKSLYSWLKSKLVGSTGVVYDHIDLNGAVTNWSFTYNQGAFIGAGVALYKLTNDVTYLNDAIKSADYAKANMHQAGVLTLQNEGTSGDAAGFKGIFTRYMKNLIVDGGQTQFTSWMQLNADAVWNNRRSSDNLTYPNWDTLTPGGTLESWGSSTGVAILQNTTAGGAYEVTVDNKDSGFTSVGTWGSSTSIAGYYGTDYLTDTTAGADTGKTAKWTPNLTQAGTYQVYMRWTAYSNRPVAAPLTIIYNGGSSTDTSKTVNQTLNNGTWVLVGTYALTAGTGNSVMISAANSGYTVADAVKFVKQ